MASQIKAWLGINWFSVITLVVMVGAFYTATEKTEWRVSQLETRAAANEAKTEKLSEAINQLTTTVSTTNSLLSELKRQWERWGNSPRSM